MRSCATCPRYPPPRRPSCYYFHCRWPRSPPAPALTHHPGMLMPKLMVMGRRGACGKMNLVLGSDDLYM